jgi:hypothetical protein
MHGTLDWRLLEPKPYLAYCPCTVPQKSLLEKIHIIGTDGNIELVENTGSPPAFKELGPRNNYNTAHPIPLSDHGRSIRARLGDVVQARSGDKGPNINIGFTVKEEDEWLWLQSFLDRSQMQQLMGEEYNSTFKIERCELPGICAVHFVIYGILRRGVSSTARLDALGKGFAEFIRDRWIDVPEKFLSRYRGSLPASHGQDILITH